MLVKEDMPMSHRAALVLAATFTAQPLITWAFGLGFHPVSWLVGSSIWWLCVWYQWRLRSRTN